MPIVVTCPTCSTRVRAPDTAAGKRVKCPKCASIIPVPTGEPEEENIEILPSPIGHPAERKQDAPRDERRARRPVVNRGAPRPTRGGIPRIVWQIGVPFVLFTMCCGGCATVLFFSHKNATEGLAQADGLYAEGKQEEAVRLYKEHFEYASDKPKILKRIVEFEAVRNKDDAKKWIQRGQKAKLVVSYEGEGVNNLLAEMKREDEDRQAARDREKVDKLVRDLKSPDIGTRRDAATALGRLGPQAKSAVPALVATFNDKTFEVPVWRESRAALIALGENSAPGIGAIVRQGGDQLVRWNLIEILKEMGPSARSAVPDLAVVLKLPAGDENDDLRFGAAYALAVIDPDCPGLLAMLVEAMAYDGVNRSEAIESLKAMGPKAKPAIPALRQVANGTLKLKYPAKPEPDIPVAPGGVRTGDGVEYEKKLLVEAANLVRELER